MILIWLGFEKYRFLALIPYHFVLKYANVHYSFFFNFYFTASLYVFYFILLSYQLSAKLAMSSYRLQGHEGRSVQFATCVKVFHLLRKVRIAQTCHHDLRTDKMTLQVLLRS